MPIKIRFVYQKRIYTYLQENDYSKKEEQQTYDNLLKDILKNTRWYLDNLDYLCEFKVNWEEYHRKHYSRDYKRGIKCKAL